MNTFIVRVANSAHEQFADEICKLIEISAEQRGTGIAIRSPKYITEKIDESKAIIALSKDNELVGFCYIESWGEKQYVANSGLVVKPEYRGSGVATVIKKKAFEHSQKLFPEAKLFGLTTSLPVMKINSDLGYQPVTYDRLTDDKLFWEGCQSCVNYEILQSKKQQNCMCTAMLFDPEVKGKKRWEFVKKSRLYERFMRLKKNRLNKKMIEI
jgi:N-acetylglutamate synthase-like GNAT family acetyltransferase